MRRNTESFLGRGSNKTVCRKCTRCLANSVGLGGKGLEEATENLLPVSRAREAEGRTDEQTLAMFKNALVKHT